jgi:RNA polymerase sigma factor (sigma-70 family)
MNSQELIPHLFRTEYSKIIAVLCKRFGMANLEAAEDITSDTFLAALNTWTYNGIPENPTAWLYTVAKNKARNFLHRENTFAEKVTVEVQRHQIESVEMLDLSAANIADSQLRMLFAVCHPAIPHDAQVGLALRVLCGFGIEEIANAFLTSKETISKRLMRAREKLRSGKVVLDFPPEHELPPRLDRVLTTLYLVFNEGYYSESQDVVVRKELCFEAMRLLQLLLDNSVTHLPEVNSLMALMCFHASRLDARTSEDGFIVLYEDQDVSRWNFELIAQGAASMKAAAVGKSLSRYHLEAGIAYWHTVREDTREKWESILHLYNQLLALEYSPIAALNRTVALAKVRGNSVAIAEAEKLNLGDNHYFFVMLGELYKDSDQALALKHFQKAFDLAATGPERVLIQGKIRALNF